MLFQSRLDDLLKNWNGSLARRVWEHSRHTNRGPSGRIRFILETQSGPHCH